MEISDYLTNVLSVNDLSSIQYYYLEPSTCAEPEKTTLLGIEASWRKSGALVVHYKSGIWLFGEASELEQILPPTATIKSDGFVVIRDDVLAIKYQGSFDPANIWKSSKPLTTSSSAPSGAASPPASSDSNSRHIYSLNAKASYSNATIGLKKGSGTESSPLQDDIILLQPVFSARDIQELLISAILAKLSYHLCHENGFIPLNARTLLLPSPDYLRIGQSDSKPTVNALFLERLQLITLDVHLTLQGTLLIKAWLNALFEPPWILGPSQKLDLCESLADGTTLLLAPSGKVGRFCRPSMLDVSRMALDVVDTPVEKYNRGELFQEHWMALWKERCLIWLASKGMEVDVLERSGWVTVQVRSQYAPRSPIDTGDGGLWDPEEKIITIAWPALLCLKRITSDNVTPLPKSLRSPDPLSFAEGWYSAKAVREATGAKRRKQRESEAAALQAQADVDARNLASNSFSPAGLRRTSLAGAVYPTPPDGIQPIIGATPSFDGNGSTPGQPNPQSSALESENAPVPKAEPEDADKNLWDSGEAKRDQIINAALDFNDNDNDNLFSDMGGDLFGENDVTDADFSFFDEPDAVETMEGNTANDENSMEDIKDGSAEDNAVGEIPMDNAGPSVELDVVIVEAHFDENFGNTEGQALADQAIQIAVNTSAEHPPAGTPKRASLIKSHSPPLSPGLIFQKLSTTRIDAGDLKRSKSTHRAVGTFDGIPFDKSLSSFNKKYGIYGRFMYPSVSKHSDQPVTRSLPRTGYLSNTRKRKPTVAELLNQPFTEPDEALNPGLDNNDNPSGAESLSYSNPASPISDQDDTSTSSGSSRLAFSSSLKRKRGSNDIYDDDNDEMTFNLHDMKVDRTKTLQVSDLLDLLDDSLLDADAADWSLASFLSSPEPRHLTGSLDDAEYIASAQVLADQAISLTLHIPIITDNSRDNYIDNGIDEHSIKTRLNQKLSYAAKSCFDRAAECTMVAFTDIQELQHSGPGSRMAPRPTAVSRVPHASEATKPSSIFNLPAPHLEVQRSESKLTVLPPAIPFWESLGLAPCKGPKDVSAICIYPDGVGVSDSVEIFLEQIRNAYESSRLGSHERFSHADLVDGHVPMDFGDGALLSVADHQHVLSKIQQTSAKVGPLLAAGPFSETNLVIYYIYDSATPELLVPICSAFHDLFERYKESLDNEKLPVSNELVFQLVPMHFVTSKTALVVPPPIEFTRLAMEVYDRCVDLNTGTSVPSIVLEQALPRVIDFKLMPNPSASPLQENSCMHVAYAQSLDDRWITSAWTDNTGTQQMTASYCLGRRNSPLTTSFPSIAREIWETTLGIIAFQNVNWRILIAKSGVMDPPEIEVWQSLASESNQSLTAKESNTQITLTLITVDTNPSLELLPPSISVAPSILAAQSSLYTTPVSTPQASIFSPEPGNANTPARDSGPNNALTPNDSSAELKIDADATLVDITDQTWGAILSHRLNNSRSLLEFNPTLISGYLIKRSGATPLDVPIVIEVNIVHSEVYPRMYDALLREILGFYRGFATLARVRGCVDPVKDGRPWHIAAVEKGVQTLYVLM